MTDSKIIKLTGQNFASYQAGLHAGAAEAYEDGAKTFEKFRKHFELVMERVSTDDPYIHSFRNLAIMAASAEAQIRGRAGLHANKRDQEIDRLEGWLVTKKSGIRSKLWTVAIVGMLVAGSLTYAAMAMIR